MGSHRPTGKHSHTPHSHTHPHKPHSHNPHSHKPHSHSQPSTTTAPVRKRCDGWCNGNRSPWSQKCSWTTQACSGCSQCSAATGGVSAQCVRKYGQCGGN